jgi:hypothetical protein
VSPLEVASELTQSAAEARVARSRMWRPRRLLRRCEACPAPPMRLRTEAERVPASISRGSETLVERRKSAGRASVEPPS